MVDLKIPGSLERALRERRVLPFVGAGVSMAVQRKDGKPLFPSWVELLRRGADALEAERKDDEANYVRAALKVKRADLLAAAKRVQEELGPVWASFLKSQFDVQKDRADPASLALAQAVWGLGSRVVLTTNFDRVLRWACPTDWKDDLAEWDVSAVAEHALWLRERSTKATLWHLHGKIDNVADLVLTPDGYRRLYHPDSARQDQHAAALATLRSQLATQTFLFVGFSFTDEHFGAELESLKELYQGYNGPHYVLMHRAKAGAFRDAGHPVEVVEYEDHGEPLVALLKELGRLAAGPAAASPPIAVAPKASVALPPNPFGDQGKITDPARFFDREEVLAEIFGDLAAGRNISLVGEAQIGKSSVLWQVCQQGPARFGRPQADFVYLNLELLQGDADFFAALADALGVAGTPNWQLHRKLGDRKIVLCLDEVEKMTYTGFTREVRSQLRGLCDGQGAAITLLVASRSTLDELFPDHQPGDTSPLANCCPLLRLEPFTLDATRLFLAERMQKTGLSFAETEVERLWQETGGHPGRLQLQAQIKFRQLRRPGA